MTSLWAHLEEADGEWVPVPLCKLVDSFKEEDNQLFAF